MLARRSRLWAWCRSLTHPSNDHSASHHIMLTGRSLLPDGFDPNKPRPGDWPAVAAVAGYARPAVNNLPPAVVLPELLNHRTGRVIPGQFAGQMGPLGAVGRRRLALQRGRLRRRDPEYGFHHETGAQPKGSAIQAPNLSLPESLDLRGPGPARPARRRRWTAVPSWSGLAEADEFDRHRQEAVALLSDAAVRLSFDVTHAEPKSQDRYGRNAFGWSLLMARRLVEAGVRLVQVNLGNNETWDTHQSAFPNLKQFLLPPLDRSVSAPARRPRRQRPARRHAGRHGRPDSAGRLAFSRSPGRSRPARSLGPRADGLLRRRRRSRGRGGRLLRPPRRRPATEPGRRKISALTIYHALGIPAAATWDDAAGRPHNIYYGEPIFVRRKAGGGADVCVDLVA